MVGTQDPAAVPLGGGGGRVGSGVVKAVSKHGE